MTQDAKAGPSLLRDVIRSCRRRGKRLKIADSTGVELSGERTLIAALALRRLLRRALGDDETRVGVLLPPTAGAALAQMALAFDGRVAVGVNYTLTAEIIDPCLARAGVRHVLTSRRFLERMPLALEADYIYLEDLRAKATWFDKLQSALLAKTAPPDLLLRAIGRTPPTSDEPFIVVFTSGTTGEPKGAVITYGNAQASVNAIEQAIRLDPKDVLIGVLPFFHAFGTIVTLWTALALDIAVVYHPNPLDAEGVGQLCQDQGVTILVATPTFLRGYQRRGKPEQFRSLDTIITGGERLPKEIADEVERAFGIRPVEGYGATETTSLIAANIPPHRVLPGHDSLCREGTVGRPLPGVRLKLLDPDTGEERGREERGALWVAGPNVMAGYLDRPELTRQVVRDGWYATGDMAVIHDDGSVEIVGRRSRFAKIGGEMVPLDTVQQALTAALGEEADENPPLAVVSVPDAARGERLVVVHRPMANAPFDLVHNAAAAGLPPLYRPSAADFIEIEQLPLTATGKLDFGRLGAIAKTTSAVRRVG
jgi:acyl-[acyl-carrier-protein]-phospholipid O-acyltransferase/long-chain-fatty-acid--[acyl-carrier-protein] ligase